MHLNDTDMQLIAILQRDASIAVEELAKRVGITKTPCWRRLQKLEKSGIIKKKVALLDAALLDLSVSVFVQVKTSKHESDWLIQFSKTVSAFPEVVDFYRMSGEYDYLLRVVVKDIASYDAFYQRFIQETSLTDVTSSFAMEEIKRSTELPLPSFSSSA